MANITVYAVIIGFLFAGCFLGTVKPQFFDLSQISYNIVQLTEDLLINFSVGSKGRLVEIHCLNCIEVKNEQAKCKNKQIVYLILQIEYLSKNYSASVIIDCQLKNTSLRYPSISNLKTEASTDQIKLSWDTNSKETIQYIVDIMNSTHQSYKFISTEENVFILDNLRERTLYEVCIAAVNNQWIMSSYRCIQERTDFSKSGPVTNHTIQAFANQILLSWSKPQYHLDDPQGYVINYINTINKTCHTIIIDMKNHKLPKDLGCSHVTVKRWNNLQVLQIRDLIPDTEYNIEILPFNRNKDPDGLFLTSRTTKIDSVHMKFVALENFNYTISKTLNKGRITFKYDEKIIQILIIGNKNTLIKKKFLFCTENEIVMLKLIMRLKDEVSIPYIIPCRFAIHKNEILSLTAKHHESMIKIQWSLRHLSYANIIYYHDGQLEIIPRMSSKNDSHSILNVTNQRSHICLVTLNLFQESINRFKCLTVEPHNSSIGPVTNIRMVVLNEMIFLKWEPPVNQSVHLRGYILNYNNSNDLCKTILINKVNQKDSSTMLCGNMTRLFTSPSQKYVPITSLTSDTTYKIDIIHVHNPISPTKASFTIRTTNDDCFIPCSESTFNMKIIRNKVQACNAFKSLEIVHHKVKLSRVCSLVEFQLFMCPDKGSKVCNLPKCSSLQKISGCVTDTDFSVYGSSVTVAWTPQESGDETKGYITMLYTNSRCEQFNLQLCQNCSMTIRGSMLNYYKNCQHKTEESSLLYETTFENLKERQRYIIFIVPLLDDGYLGAVRQLSFDTSKINNTFTVNNNKVPKLPSEKIDILEKEDNMDLDQLEEVDLSHFPREKMSNTSKTSEKDIEEIDTDYNYLTDVDLEEVNTNFETEQYPVKDIKPQNNSKDENVSVTESELLVNSMDQREIISEEDTNTLEQNIPISNSDPYEEDNTDENDFKKNKKITSKNKTFRWLDTLKRFAQLFNEVKYNYDHSKNRNLSKSMRPKFRQQKENKSLSKRFKPQKKYFSPLKSDNIQRWNNKPNTNMIKTNDTRRTNSFKLNHKKNIFKKNNDYTKKNFRWNNNQRTNNFRWNNNSRTNIFGWNNNQRTNNFGKNNIPRTNNFRWNNNSRTNIFGWNNNQRTNNFGKNNIPRTNNFRWNNNQRTNNFRWNNDQRTNNFRWNNNQRTNNFRWNNNQRTNIFGKNNNPRTNNFRRNNNSRKNIFGWSNNQRTNNFRWNKNSRMNNFRWNDNQRKNNFLNRNRFGSRGSRGGGRRIIG